MDKNTASELEAVAALAAATNAQVSQLNEDIIGEGNSTGIKFDAKDILESHMAQVGVPDTPPPPPHAQGTDHPVQSLAGGVDGRWASAPPQQAAPVQYAQPPMSPLQAHITLPPNVEARLDSIDEQLKNINETLLKLASLEKKVGKFVERGLNNRVKQVTLRLDGPTSSK